MGGGTASLLLTEGLVKGVLVDSNGRHGGERVCDQYAGQGWVGGITRRKVRVEDCSRASRNSYATSLPKVESE